MFDDICGCFSHGFLCSCSGQKSCHKFEIKILIYAIAKILIFLFLFSFSGTDLILNYLTAVLIFFLFFLAFTAYCVVKTKRKQEDLDWQLGNAIQEREHARTEHDSACTERDRAWNQLCVLDWVHNLGPVQHAEEGQEEGDEGFISSEG